MIRARAIRRAGAALNALLVAKQAIKNAPGQRTTNVLGALVGAALEWAALHSLSIAILALATIRDALCARPTTTTMLSRGYPHLGHRLPLQLLASPSLRILPCPGVGALRVDVR